MKKLLSIILILVLLSSVSVFAEPVLPEFQDNKVSYIDSTWINYDPEYVVWMVILTPYQERANVKYDISPIIKQQINESLDSAYGNIEEIEGLINTDEVNYSLKALFDVTITDTVVKLLDVKEGISLRLRVDAGLKQGDSPVVMHSLESKAGTWEALDSSKVWVNGDGSLTVLLDSFCPIAVFLPTEAPAKEAEVKEEVVLPSYSIGWPLYLIIGLSIVGLIIAAVVFNLIETKKTNSRILFAFERLKLNLEIIAAKMRAR